MSEFTTVLFKNLGLPFPTKGERLSANYNALTKEVDGNTDSNHDGKINNNDKNGWIESEELYEEIFANRTKYVQVLKKLHAAGMEDPYEITSEIKAHVENLFKKHNPKIELEKSIILFRSVIPQNKSFKVKGVCYFGLSEAEGGLEISYNPDFNAPLRKRLGDLLPKEILATSKGKRIAHCVEYSHLLVILHRAAGIRAYPKRISDPKHVYVIANLDGDRYRLDAGGSSKGILFIKTKEAIDNDSRDRARITAHYLNEARMFMQQRKAKEAIKRVTTALEFKSTSAYGWGLMGVFLARQGKLKEALRCYNKSLRFAPNVPIAWKAKAEVLKKLGRNKEAAECEKKFRLLLKSH